MNMTIGFYMATMNTYWLEETNYMRGKEKEEDEEKGKFYDDGLHIASDYKILSF